MKTFPPGGVPLLTEDEAAALLGVSTAQFGFYAGTLGFIRPMDTPVGPRYREDELKELREAIAPAIEKMNRLRPGEAARLLGVTTRTLVTFVNAGRLHRDPVGFYDAVEVRALAAQRDADKMLWLPASDGT